MKPRTISRIFLHYLWDRLKVSFWFTPLVMSLAALLLAWVIFRVDALMPGTSLLGSPLFVKGTNFEYRTILINIATTILATAGVVFSLLTLPLSMVAAQYGSRLVRVYLADRTTQFVLGMFAATFVYCIAAATKLSHLDPLAPSSPAAVSAGIVLMLATVTSLILLIQHISTMLQAPFIVAAAGKDLQVVVGALARGEVWSGNQPPGQAVQGPRAAAEGSRVLLTHTGYLQYIDLEAIRTLAREREVTIHLLARPGQFVWPGVEAARVHPPGRADRQMERQLRRTFLIGKQRMPTQDVEYAVNQLVEIAIRAVSRTISDPFTAITCLDYLGIGLAQLARSDEVSSSYYDRSGQLLFTLQPATFAELLNAAFDKLRHDGRHDASVLMHMLKVIDHISEQAGSPQIRHELIRHACLIQQEGQTGGLIEQDLQLIRLQSEALQAKLDQANFAGMPLAPGIS